MKTLTLLCSLLFANSVVALPAEEKPTERTSIQKKQKVRRGMPVRLFRRKHNPSNSMLLETQVLPTMVRKQSHQQ
jgi:hypothetical protein